MYQRPDDQTARSGRRRFSLEGFSCLAAQGRAAMWIDGVGWAPPIEDPNALVSSQDRAMPWCPALDPRPVFLSPPMATASALPRPSRKKKNKKKNKEKKEGNPPISICQLAVSRPMGRSALAERGGFPFTVTPYSTTCRGARAVKIRRSGWIVWIGSAKILQNSACPCRSGAEFATLSGRRHATLSGSDPATN